MIRATNTHSTEAVEEHLFHHKGVFQLESGAQLPELYLKYTTMGRLNAKRDNVIWIAHALTANANPREWWGGLVGKGKFFNPESHFIVCANVLGSCYGSTGPLSQNPETQKCFYHGFPEITIRDIVNGLDMLRKDLGLEKINTLIGGSMGGQQALEWAIKRPKIVKNLVLLATNARHSPWGKAFNESQRMAIRADQSWRLENKNAGKKGMKAARSIALLSYRTYQTYEQTQQDENNSLGDYKAVSYQKYQGEKLSKRFNAFSYWHLSMAMDSHNVGRHRESIEKALSQISARTVVIAIKSDLLFPVVESKELAEKIPRADLVLIESHYGHDGFLIETQKLNRILEKHLEDSKNTLT